MANILLNSDESICSAPGDCTVPALTSSNKAFETVISPVEYCTGITGPIETSMLKCETKNLLYEIKLAEDHNHNHPFFSSSPETLDLA